MYSLRNKNKERFRTQALRETTDETPNQSERPYNLFHTSPAQNQINYARESQDTSSLVIRNLQKHIEYIEKKLAESEAEKQGIKNKSQWLRSQLDQRDAVIERKVNKIRQNQKSAKDILTKYENLKTDVENYKLQQKVEKLNRQINQQKEFQKKTESQFASKKDKFSSAFLPSPFGSPMHYSQKPSEIFQNIIKDDLSQSNYLSKNPFEESLWSEWRKLKSEKVKRQKQLANQASNNQKLKNELITQKKHVQKVKMEYDRREQKSIAEINKLKARIGNYIKDQKILMGKLKINQQKIMELSLSMKQKGQNDGDRFFAHSSALQLQQIFEKISHNLDLDSSTIDLTIENNKKVNFLTQTSGYFEEFNLKKIDELNVKIKDLQLLLSNKQQQWQRRFQKSNNSLMAELKDASDMMDLYKQRIQHLTKTISDHQDSVYNQIRSQEFSKSRITQQIGITCHLAEQNQSNYEELSEKIRSLIEVKEQQSEKITFLQEQNEQLSHKIEEEQAKQQIDRQRRIKQTKNKYQISQIEEDSIGDCQNCKKWKQLLSQSQVQHINLVQTMQKKIRQGEHFQHSLQDVLNKYQNLQSETHTEIRTLKTQLMQKQKQIINLSMELEQKHSQSAAEKDEIEQLRKIIHKLQNQIEVYQEKMDAQLQKM